MVFHVCLVLAIDVCDVLPLQIERAVEYLLQNVRDELKAAVVVDDEIVVVDALLP